MPTAAVAIGKTAIVGQIVVRIGQNGPIGPSSVRIAASVRSDWQIRHLRPATLIADPTVARSVRVTTTNPNLSNKSPSHSWRQYR